MTTSGSDDVDALIDRVHRGDATPQEIRELMAWRRASVANEHSYRRTMRLLGVAGQLAGSVASEPPTAQALLAGRTPVRRVTLRRRAAVAAPWIVAAAALAFAFGRPAGTRRPELALAAIVTGASEMTTLELGDGSVVRLAPSSRLRVTPTDSTREVVLDGRAFFAVAKMPHRPFIVRTRAGDATALGTRFEITTQRKELRLVVVEGRVALSTAGHRVEVSGGEVSGVREDVPMQPSRVPDADRMDSWVGKFLVFQATPMRDAAREIEQVYGVRVVADPAIAERTVTATFTDQTAEQVLEVVCSVTHARCLPTGGAVRITPQP